MFADDSDGDDHGHDDDQGENVIDLGQPDWLHYLLLHLHRWQWKFPTAGEDDAGDFVAAAVVVDEFHRNGMRLTCQSLVIHSCHVELVYLVKK